MARFPHQIRTEKTECTLVWFSMKCSKQNLPGNEHLGDCMKWKFMSFFSFPWAIFYFGSCTRWKSNKREEKLLFFYNLKSCTKPIREIFKLIFLCIKKCSSDLPSLMKSHFSGRIYCGNLISFSFVKSREKKTLFPHQTLSLNHARWKPFNYTYNSIFSSIANDGLLNVACRKSVS